MTSRQYHAALEAAGHVLIRDEDGEIDAFQKRIGIHNGPGPMKGAKIVRIEILSRPESRPFYYSIHLTRFGGRAQLTDGRVLLTRTQKYGDEEDVDVLERRTQNERGRDRRYV